MGSRLLRRDPDGEGAVPPIPWETSLEDPRIGPLRLSGKLHLPEGADELLVAVHGLGGCCDSHYMVSTARAATSAGVACLRLNLRGADRRGEDYYHAGLTDDLEAALASPEAAPYRRVYVLGFSLGGLMVLRWAGTRWAESSAPVNAVAAVSAPLDLAKLSDRSETRAYWPYRRYLLGRLNEIYAAVARRREVPIPMAEAARIRSFREWDRRVVAPRHGFAGAGDYYRRASAAPVLREIPGPALYVGSNRDPLVPPPVVWRDLEAAGEILTVRWLHQGGHLSYPDRVRLHRDPREAPDRAGGTGEEHDASLDHHREAPLEKRVLGWLRSAGAAL